MSQIGSFPQVVGIGVKMKKKHHLDLDHIKTTHLDHISNLFRLQFLAYQKTSFSPSNGSCLSGPWGSSPVPSWTAACPSAKLAPRPPRLRDYLDPTQLLEPNAETSPCWRRLGCFYINMQHVCIWKYHIWVICNVKKKLVRLYKWLDSCSKLGTLGTNFYHW